MIELIIAWMVRGAAMGLGSLGATNAVKRFWRRRQNR